MTVERVVEAILGVLPKVPRCEISPDSDFVTDLGMDSLDLAEVVVALDPEQELDWEPFFSARVTAALIEGHDIRITPKAIADFIDGI